MHLEPLAFKRWDRASPGAPGILPARNPRAGKGFTLIELLCVMAIISILASLLLPAVMRAYNRAKTMAEEFEAPEIAHLLLTRTRNYCAVHPQFRFSDSSDFSDKCQLPPKCRDWLRKPTTDFIPFTYADPTNLVVLTVHMGRRQAILYAFTKGDLSLQPE